MEESRSVPSLVNPPSYARMHLPMGNGSGNTHPHQLHTTATAHAFGATPQQQPLRKAPSMMSMPGAPSMPALAPRRSNLIQPLTATTTATPNIMASFQSANHHQHQLPNNMHPMNMNMPPLGMHMGSFPPQLPHLPMHQPHSHPSGGFVSAMQPPPSTATPPANESTPVPFWRPSALEASYSANHQLQKHNGASIELELSDLLGAPSSNSSSSDESNAQVTGMMGPSAFEVPESFHMPSKPSSYALPTLHHPSAPQPEHEPSSSLHHDQDPATPPSSSSASNAPSSPSGSSDMNPTARGMTPPDPSEYSRFVDSREAPDLSQHKIDEKNEKCQFHNCPNRARVSQAYGKFCNRHVIVAPCGFPGCRDKAMVNTSMCEKHLAEGKEALHRILANRAQNVPVCRTFGCFKNDQGRGYCRGHEKLLMATGRLPKHINKRRLNSAYTMCSYPNCNKHSQRHHLCRTHGNLIMKEAAEMAEKGETNETYEEILARLQKEIRRCTHPNCSKNSQRDRLCTMHYYEKHNQKGPTQPPVDTTAPHEEDHATADQSEASASSQLHALRPPMTTTIPTGFQHVETHAKERPTTCSNPICQRESAGREFCDSCQSVFAPLVVSVNGSHASSGFVAPMIPSAHSHHPHQDATDGSTSNSSSSSSSSSYWNATSSSGFSHTKENEALCRVRDCHGAIVRAGLCEKHSRSFEEGALSVDELTLRSRHFCEKEAAAQTAMTVISPVASNAHSKTKKYFCRVDNCDKQAQKKGLCKRHFRQQQLVDPSLLKPSNSALFDMVSSHFAQVNASAECRFPSCHNAVRPPSTLCAAHAHTCLCWHPTCEIIVPSPSFCQEHARQQHCAYDHCGFAVANHAHGSCMQHATAKRCRHDHCGKFAMEHAGACRLHQGDCTTAPCVLCRLHAHPPSFSEF